MSWSVYCWVWMLESPLHIGAPPAGMLNRTRLYIPARSLWGALTAELARSEYASHPDYRKVGEILRHKTRLSYLFPAEQVGDAWKAWLPIYQEGRGLVWEREDGKGEEIEDRNLRMRLLITRPGTAIQPETGTAAQGTLREFELVGPYWRERHTLTKPVAFVGYLFCKDDNLCKKLKDIQTLFIGGDVRYGLGRLRQVAWTSSVAESNRFFGEAQLDLNQQDPRVITDRILAHLRPQNVQDRLIGAMECLRGWDMVAGSMSPPELTWVPGSCCLQKVKLEFAISEDNLWQLKC